MKIKFIIFSHTGHTASVAKKLVEKLKSKGHEVDYSALENELPDYDPQKSSQRDIEFNNLPDLSEYEYVVFGSPVQAFSLSPVMKKYFSKVDDLNGKKVALLTTEAFPFAWMGGWQAINRMKKECEKKGAKVLGSGIVNWSRKNREKQIEEVVERLAGLF